MGKHALLSASSSHRWLNCPPSARLCEQYEDRGSSYAAEGTEALADSELNRFASFVRDSLLSEDTAPHESIYEDMIQLYKYEIRKKDVWISRLFWCLAGIMMFILFVLVFDILNPTFGFVMY